MILSKLKFFLLIVLGVISADSYSQKSNIDSLRLVIPNGHNAPIIRAHINSSMDYLISTAYDNKIKIWDVDSQKELSTFNSHSDLILTFASMDGENKVLSSDVSGDFFIWDIYSNEIVFSKNDLGLISSISCVPEKSIALLASENGWLYEYSFISNSLTDSVSLFENEMGEINTQFIAEEELIIAFKEFSNEIDIYSLKSEKVQRILHPDIGKIEMVIFDDKKDCLIVLDGNNSLHTINVHTGARIKTLVISDYKLNCIAKNEGFGIIAGNNSGELIFYDENFIEIDKRKVSNESIEFVSPTVKGIEYIVISQKSSYEKNPGETPIRISYLDIVGSGVDSNFLHLEFFQPFTHVFMTNDLSHFLAGSDDFFLYHLNLKNYLYSFFEGKTEYYTNDDLKIRDSDYFKAQTTQGSVSYNGEYCKLVYDYDGVLVLQGITSDSVYRSTYLNSNNKFINHYKISLDSSFVYELYKGDDDRDVMEIFSLRSEKLVKRINFGFSEYCPEAIFSPDGNYIFVISTNKVLIYELRSFKIVKRIEFSKGSYISHIDVSNGRGLTCVSEDDKIYLYNSQFELINEFQMNADISDMRFSISGDYLAVSSDDGFLCIINCNLNDIVIKLKIFDGRICETLFGDTEEMIFLKSFDDNLSKIFSIEHRKIVLEYLDFQNGGWFVKLPNLPYYMCSKDASKMLHYVTPSLKVIGFDQLDPFYNRPDIVLDSIGKYFGGADKDLVANYHAAWEKRIERLGLDKDKLSLGEIAVPNAEITNANQIQFENKVGKVVIHVEANDPKYKLRRYNVLVNEVPIYGSAGVSIADLNTQVWEHTDTITLSKGRNKIQVSIMNELGLENFKYPTYVNYTPKNDIASKTYYVGIGVNEFKHAGHNLKYCVKDVQDLARAFANNQSRVDTILFTDQEVTKENILALKSYLQDNTTVNDKVIISCSSHGLLDDSLNFYLATYDVDFSNPKERGLKYEELESLLDGIPARQKLLLLDACNSGENERLLIERNKNNDLASNDPKKKGEELEVVNKEIQSFQKMNELFVNVRNNTGSVVISAAGGLQSALEAIEVDGKEIKNGAFTFSVLECLSKNYSSEIKVKDLKLYVEKRVEEITNGKQKPTSRQETMEVDWVVKKAIE